jgi:hypothetical protein
VSIREGLSSPEAQRDERPTLRDDITAAIVLLECAEDKMFGLLPREEFAATSATSSMSGAECNLSQLGNKSTVGDVFLLIADNERICALLCQDLEYPSILWFLNCVFEGRGDERYARLLGCLSDGDPLRRFDVIPRNKKAHPGSRWDQLA